MDQVQRSRRAFLKRGTFLGSSLAAPALLGMACNSPAEQAAPSEPSPMDPPLTRKLGTGKHQLEVSAVGLGCMGMSYHRSFIPDKQAMVAFLRRSAEYGLNFYDTAETYGPLSNEKLVREALKPLRHQVILATKFGFKNGRPSEGLDSRPERIKAVVDQSLSNLQTDYID